MTLTTRLGIFQNIAQGKCTVMPQNCQNPSTPTTAAASSGYYTGAIRSNTAGSAQPGTIVQMLSNDAATPQMLTVMNSTHSTSVGKSGLMGRLYRFGGTTLTGTGNNYVHDAATFPANRTVMNASTAINFIPMIFVTVLTATTAPQFTINYTNQSGASVTGNVTFIMPAAATATSSLYIPMLNYGDSGIQDITGVNVTVAGTAGAVDFYGFEPNYLSCNIAAGLAPSIHNSAIGPMSFRNMSPAVATTGTATTYKSIISLATDFGSPCFGFDVSVSNV